MCSNFLSFFHLADVWVERKGDLAPVMVLMPMYNVHIGSF